MMAHATKAALTTQFGASTTTRELTYNTTRRLSSPKRRRISVKNPARAEIVETSPGAARIVQMRDSSAHWTRGFCEANVPMGGHDVHRWGFGHVREANDDGGVE